MAQKYLIKFSAINLYFKNNETLLERGENAFQSGHVESIKFNGELLSVCGMVHASMKNKKYKVKVYYISMSGRIINFLLFILCRYS